MWVWCTNQRLHSCNPSAIPATSSTGFSSSPGLGVFSARKRNPAQGIAGGFLVKLVGSYTNVVGLPLYETVTLLAGEGYPIHFGWINAG